MPQDDLIKKHLGGGLIAPSSMEFETPPPAYRDEATPMAASGLKWRSVSRGRERSPWHQSVIGPEDPVADLITGGVYREVAVQFRNGDMVSFNDYVPEFVEYSEPGHARPLASVMKEAGFNPVVMAFFMAYVDPEVGLASLSEMGAVDVDMVRAHIDRYEVASRRYRKAYAENEEYRASVPNRRSGVRRYEGWGDLQDRWQLQHSSDGPGLLSEGGADSVTMTGRTRNWVKLMQYAAAQQVAADAMELGMQVGEGTSALDTMIQAYAGETNKTFYDALEDYSQSLRHSADVLEDSGNQLGANATRQFVDMMNRYYHDHRWSGVGARSDVQAWQDLMRMVAELDDASEEIRRAASEGRLYVKLGGRMGSSQVLYDTLSDMGNLYVDGGFNQVDQIMTFVWDHPPVDSQSFPHEQMDPAMLAQVFSSLSRQAEPGTAAAQVYEAAGGIARLFGEFTNQDTRPTSTRELNAWRRKMERYHLLLDRAFGNPTTRKKLWDFVNPMSGVGMKDIFDEVTYDRYVEPLGAIARMPAHALAIGADLRATELHKLALRRDIAVAEQRGDHVARNAARGELDTYKRADEAFAEMERHRKEMADAVQMAKSGADAEKARKKLAEAQRKYDAAIKKRSGARVAGHFPVERTQALQAVQDLLLGPVGRMSEQVLPKSARSYLKDKGLYDPNREMLSYGSVGAKIMHNYKMYADWFREKTGIDLAKVDPDLKLRIDYWFADAEGYRRQFDLPVGMALTVALEMGASNLSPRQVQSGAGLPGEPYEMMLDKVADLMRSSKAKSVRAVGGTVPMALQMGIEGARQKKAMKSPALRPDVSAVQPRLKKGAGVYGESLTPLEFVKSVLWPGTVEPGAQKSGPSPKKGER